MQKIAWITDSTCYIDPHFAKENHILCCTDEYFL